jgi:hypothetical protein
MAARGGCAAGRARSAYWRDTLAADCQACYFYKQSEKILLSLGALPEQLAHCSTWATFTAALNLGVAEHLSLLERSYSHESQELSC